MLPEGVHHFPGRIFVASAHSGADAERTAAVLGWTLNGTMAQGLV